MIIGILREIKTEEYRVAMTPAGAEVMEHHGHRVIVEKNAGAGSGFDDGAYRAAGAEIAGTAAEVYRALPDGHARQGAAAFGIPADPPGSDPVHLFPSGGERGADAGDDQEPVRRDRLRNHPEGRRHPAAADPDERGGRTDGDPGGRQVSRDGVRRGGDPARRRPRGGTGDGAGHRRGDGGRPGGQDGLRSRRQGVPDRFLPGAAPLSRPT